jgi:hypothetical protein
MDGVASDRCAARSGAICAALLALILGLYGIEARGAGKPIAADHPIVGTWTYELPGSHCHEVFHIRPDGTTLFTSGSEIATSEFEITETPSPKGYYLMVDTIVRDNGKRDCLGQSTPVGHRASLFVRFNPAADVLVLCQDESAESCIGPLHRRRHAAS